MLYSLIAFQGRGVSISYNKPNFMVACGSPSMVYCAIRLSRTDRDLSRQGERVFYVIPARAALSCARNPRLFPPTSFDTSRAQPSEIRDSSRGSHARE